MQFIKLVSFIPFLFILSSCKYEPKPFRLEQNDICKYFYLKTDSVIVEGKKHIVFRPETHDSIKDNATRFIKNYWQRFDFVLIKEMNELLSHDTLKGINKETQFCERIQEKKFYKNVQLLLPTDTARTFFSKDEMMLVASRFFYCDTVLKKGDKIGVGWHICVGINGLSELANTRDLTALEAFSYEAINSAMLKEKKPLFVRNFIDHVNETNKKEKPFYTDDKTHLEKVKQQCYKLMQNNKALEKALLDYFKKEKKSFGFVIK